MESRVHPDLRGMLSMMPQEKFTREAISDIRAAMGQMFGAGQQADNDVVVHDKYIPGPIDAPDIRVRIYEPLKKADNHPGVLYIHGGGYILGAPEMTDAGCRQMVSEIGCIVVSVDYRLAPEHPYPAPLEDCYAALTWLSEHACELGVDASRIAVAGGSAGGGLTAALTLLARDRKGPHIVFQAPLYPMIDDRNTTHSSHEFADPRVWSREKNLFAWEMYLGPIYEGDVPYYAAPARAEDLSGLPPAYTYIGELDLFRDETIDYVAKLLRAGVPTEFHIYPGCFHAFDMFTGIAEISRRAEQEFIQALKRALVK
jgi:acetyl esterase/lipase